MVGVGEHQSVSLMSDTTIRKWQFVSGKPTEDNSVRRELMRL